MDPAEILRDAETIAVVGCSGRRTRPSHNISKYLLHHGYRVIPINPNYDVIHGQTCYPDLAAVPEDIVIDVVNIFRNPRHVETAVRSAIERAENGSLRPVIWTQLGVSTPAAEQLARHAGLTYVANRCIMMEHVRIG